MDTISIKEARIRFAKLINAAQRGSGIAITRRGKTVAQLLPPPATGRKPLPDLSAFRATIKIQGKSLSRTVVAQRQKNRY